MNTLDIACTDQSHYMYSTPHYSVVFNIRLPKYMSIVNTYNFIITLFLLYPGSQAPFWGEEVTSPAIVGLNIFLVRLCHPIEGLGGLLTNFFWHDG